MEHVEIWYRYSDSSEWIEIDPEQLWFWSEEWQAKEKEVDEDLRLGRYEDFNNLDDFFDF